MTKIFCVKSHTMGAALETYYYVNEHGSLRLSRTGRWYDGSWKDHGWLINWGEDEPTFKTRQLAEERICERLKGEIFRGHEEDAN